MTRSPEKFILEMKEINSNIEILGTYTKPSSESKSNARLVERYGIR